MGLPGLKQYICPKQKIKCLAQGQNAVPPVRLKPATHRVKHSTTEPPRSYEAQIQNKLWKIKITGIGIWERQKLIFVIRVAQLLALFWQ